MTSPHKQTALHIENQTIPADRLPQLPGVYLFGDRLGRVLYVGKALNLRSRVSSYFGQSISEKTKFMRNTATRVWYIQTDSELTALLLEAALIRTEQPRFNILSKDDKHALYIKITTHDEFPKVSTTRREIADGATYFGPFPQSSQLRAAMRTLRRIFPYCQRPSIGKRACFYHHLGLCDPCPANIVKADSKTRTHHKRIYRRNIKRLMQVLSGKHDNALRELRRQMQTEADREQFEQAGTLKRQIEQLENITTRRYRIASFLENPAFLHEQRSRELQQLRTRLAHCYPQLPHLHRIECFDISNLFGQDAVGSMVVLIDGVADPNQYRRFKIRTVSGISDVAMMREVIQRRLKHLGDWGVPDLLVIDGGKTQVASAQKALKEATVAIPVIGLAKRLEQIVAPDSGGWSVLRLPISDPAINLLRNVRDEAHRIALSYHKKLRSKSLLNV